MLAAGGATWADVVKTTVYLAGLADFPGRERSVRQHIGAARPARSTVQVAALPRNALVEIDAIAYVEGVNPTRARSPPSSGNSSHTREELFRLTAFARCAG